MSERGSTASGNQIRELKVSGHTMALEPGVYCVFNAPDGPAVTESGLPGVRISALPAAQGGTVDVASFRPDGWIGPDGAALVRVMSRPAEVMVTVYQEAGSTGEAPRLQVVRLSEGAAGQAAGAGQAPRQAAEPARVRQAPEGVEVVAHIYMRGDVTGRLGEWLGEPGSNRWIEGFGISPAGGVPPSDIEYQAVLGRGWLSPWSEGGQFCGSRGMSLPILGLRVKLRGASAGSHKVMLSAVFVDGTRVGPVGDGEACEAPSLAALEAFQVELVPVAAKAAAKPARATAKREPAGAAPAPKRGAATAKREPERAAAAPAAKRGAAKAEPAKPVATGRGAKPTKPPAGARRR